MIHALNERSRSIFRHIVEAYVESGEPIGSRTLARQLNIELSPASIRNVMADLEMAGLLYATHRSAGRMPTEAGLRFFVDGLLEVGHLDEEERKSIEAHCVAGGTVEELLTEAISALSGLSRCAGLVVAPTDDSPLRHIEFVKLGPARMLFVIVTEDGSVENRVIEMAEDVPASTITQAVNYLNSRLTGRTLKEAVVDIRAELESHRAELDELTARVVETGLATWSGEDRHSLIVRGQANLLDDVTALDDLERIRTLFDALETKREFARLLDLAVKAEGVRIFIGAENELFSLAGCSLVVAPYVNGRDQIVGALGVIGPTRLNYARIIPLVDYTAKVIGRLVGGREAAA
jgi:heat-inducible transcriptional repressor